MHGAQRPGGGEPWPTATVQGCAELMERAEGQEENPESRRPRSQGERDFKELQF